MVDIEWLSQVLSYSCDVPATIKIISFEAKPLKSGCHFSVLKLSLTYSESHGELPDSIVVRTVQWNKTFLEKIALYLKKSLNMNDYKANKLHSYEVETNFYKVYSNDIKGLKLPKVYYIHENVFQNEFKMIMEDLSQYVNGQPSGFSFNDSLMCLKQLALFHIANWNNPIPKLGTKLWDIGGYWTGGKEVNNNDIRKAWDVTVQKFHHELQISESSSNLGFVLESRLNDIMLVVNNLQPRTIIHGDYQMSNIFIDHNSTESQVYAIDWQWCGIGHVAMDVAHFIATSVDENTIEDSLKLVRFYHKIITDNGVSYSWEQFWQAYQICWIEYFIFTVIGFWSEMQADDIELYKKDEKYALHVHSNAHMKNFITQTEIFMKDLETSSVFQPTSCH